jgi:ribosomal protein S21
MDKKVVILLIVILFSQLLLAVDVSSQDNEEIEVPESVQKALEEAIETAKIEQKIPEQRKTWFDNTILSILAAMVLVLFIMVIKEYNVLHRINKTMKRQAMFRYMIRKTRKGAPISYVRKALLRKGWRTKYVNDAVYRYEIYMNRSRFVIVRILFAIKEALTFGRITRAIRRKIRRQLLFMYIIRKSRKGYSLADIRKLLSRQHWKKEHIEDAIYRFKAYKKESRNIFVRMLLAIKRIILLENLTKTIKRKLRRQFLFICIIRKSRKGQTSDKIKKELLKKGWKEIHIDDAIHRYKHQQEKEGILDSIRYSYLFERISRKIITKILFFKIIRMKKKGMSIHEIKKEIMKKNYNERIVDNALLKCQHRINLGR